MNTDKLFKNYDDKIKLASSKKDRLKQNRRALRKKIKTHFKENDWGNPKFSSQGSFPLDTNLNPIKVVTEDGDDKEEYDLDDGVYFICSENDRVTTQTYHNRILKAVEGHADSEVDKTTCVRVIYADGHHIDLPIYWSAEKDNIPQLAHKSKDFIDSDPKAFKEWVENQVAEASSNGQLRRIIRYFKGWKNYREDSNSNVNLPSGFILTILICDNLSKNDRDDLAFRDTLQNIKNTLDGNYSCYRPTTPTDEELLEKYSKDTFLNELSMALKNANKAVDSDCKKTSSEHWRKLFGERFPLGDEKETESTKSINYSSKVSAPWTSK